MKDVGLNFNFAANSFMTSDTPHHLSKPHLIQGKAAIGYVYGNMMLLYEDMAADLV